MDDLEEIYAIFKTKEVFQGGYMRFLKSDLKKELVSGNYIYRDGAYISWIDKGKYIKLKKFVSLYEGQGYGRNGGRNSDDSGNANGHSFDSAGTAEKTSVQRVVDPRFSVFVRGYIDSDDRWYRL